MEGIPPVELLGLRPRGREGNTRRGERGNLLAPLARAGQHLQRRGDKRYTRRGPTFRRPGRETRVRAHDNSTQALRCSAATPHQLRERQEQHRAEQAAQAARPDAPPGRHVCCNCRVQRVGPTTIRTGRTLGRCVRIASGWGTLKRECIRDFVPE